MPAQRPQEHRVMSRTHWSLSARSWSTCEREHEHEREHGGSLALAALTCLLVALAAACSDDSGAAACVYHSDCPPAQICAEGTCQPECREARDCPSGQSCLRGVCTPPRDDGGTGTPDGDADDAPSGDAGLDADAAGLPDTGPRPDGYGTVTGMVHFRLYDGTLLPVSQPYVYWAYPEAPPEPLPLGASCECGYPDNAVVGGADGRFRLENVPAGWVWLIVQKGRFRRQRLVEVEPGGLLMAPRETTELPVRQDPANGDEIPRIVIGTGRYDAIEDIFAKLRMGPITPTFGFDYHAYMADPGAWGVELMLYQQPRALDDAGEELVAPSFPALLGDGDRLDDYHLAFAPCAEYATYGVVMTSATVRGNVERFVDGGGKLYVTDYAYDVLEQTFPEYVDFAAPNGGDGNADGHVGDPSYMGLAARGTLMYQSENRALDPYLGSWLLSVGASLDGKVLTTGNWVNLNGVGSGEQCCDSDGLPVEVTPDVVMSGPNGRDPLFGNFGPSHDSWEAAERDGANYPHSLRFTYGCGEVMYSTYHTVDFQLRQASLAPQELVLLWLVLEIGECQLNPIKPHD
jgi:hypothetical protein